MHGNSSPAGWNDREKHSDSKGLALVVDDSATNRVILEALLKKKGYQTISAANGAQAVQFFAEKQPDIVFMDVMMPISSYAATE